ncbi:MAG: T9SS type A sorting domain-containing protein [Terrimonas sp.]|nr:T9SS type A sorting domain-containing protein [Terrimonas sp.]
MKKYNRVMKTGLLLALLIGGTCYPASSQTTVLKKLEYAFNTDPGLGNGISIMLPNVSTLDSVFTINVNGLATGIHFLFFRVQDTSNKWSLTQKTSFFKFPGNDTSSTITAVEYFLDTDPGFGNGTSLAFTPGNNVSDTFSFSIPDNGNPTRMLYVRAKDNRGVWSLLYEQEVDVCQFRAQPDFTYVQFGNRYSFIDSTSNGGANDYVWKFFHENILINSSTLSHPQIDLPPGNNRVRLIRGEGCRQDSIDKPVTTGKISKYYPNNGDAGGDVIISFYGAGLDTNATVYLRQTGAPGNFLTPTRKGSRSNYQLFTYFDLHNVTPTGNYFLEVVFSNGLKDTVDFRVNPKDDTEPVLTVQIDGPGQVRENIFNTYNITITNTSNKMAMGVPVWVVIPEYCNIDFSAFPSQIPTHYSQELKDSVLSYTIIDSINGNPYRGKMYSVLLSGVNANQSITIPVKIQVAINSARPFDIHVWTSKRMFGSSLKNFWGKCFDDIVFTVLGFVPVAGCFSGALDFLSNVGDQMVNGNQNYTGWGSYTWGIASALISCIPGGTLVTKWKTVNKIIEFYTVNNKLINAGAGAYNGASSTHSDCGETETNNGKTKGVTPANSRDPNGIFGPEGYGTERYLLPLGKAGYTINFENKPTATANAQRVYLTDTLDKNKFDLSGFHFTNFSIGDSIYFIPPALTEYTSSVRIPQFQDVDVLFNAKLDTATGILSVSYLSIDPLTKELIDTASIQGFLPPNTTPLAGEGSLSYALPIKKNLASGTPVTNRASIIFDKNEALMTNTWLNTIDTTRPANTLLSGMLVNDTVIKLSFTANDQHSGIQGHDMYFSTNNGAYRYIGQVGKDTLRFTGAPDSSYSFFVVPVDNVGNKGSVSNTVTLKLPADKNLEGKVLVFPNPGRDNFTIRFAIPEQQKVSVTLFNMTGQIVGKLYHSVAEGNISLQSNLDKLGAGIYFIQVKGDKGLKLSGKLVIIR